MRIKYIERLHDMDTDKLFPLRSRHFRFFSILLVVHIIYSKLFEL